MATTTKPRSAIKHSRSKRKCKYSSWQYLDTVTGELKRYSCGSWNCDEHRQYVALKWMYKCVAAKPQRLVTLTNVPLDARTAWLSWKHLLRDIRKEGITFEYARFLESGSKKGMLHYHILQRGDFIEQKLLAQLAVKNGFGKVCDIRSIDSKEGVFYAAKYVGKDSCPKGHRKVSYSKGFFPREKAIQGRWAVWTGKNPARGLNVSISESESAAATALALVDAYPNLDVPLAMKKLEVSLAESKAKRERDGYHSNLNDNEYKHAIYAEYWLERLTVPVQAERSEPKGSLDGAVNELSSSGGLMNINPCLTASDGNSKLAANDSVEEAIAFAKGLGEAMMGHGSASDWRHKAANAKRPKGLKPYQSEREARLMEAYLESQRGR